MPRRLGVDRAIVVGESWGAGVALVLAERHPDQVSALVLVSPVGTLSSIDAFDRLLALPGLGPALSFLGLWLLPRVLAPSGTAALARRLGIVSAGDVLPFWRRDAVWRSFVVEQRALLRELRVLARGLPSITAQATIVVGGEDRVVPPSAARDLAALLPSAQVVEVPQAGHLLSRERPSVIAEAVRVRARALEDQG